MTLADDDLMALKRALDRATPAPDPDVRAAHLRLARERFEARRRLAGRLPVPPGLLGWLRSVRGRLGLGGLAAAATAVVALVLVLPPAGQQLWQRPKVPERAVEEATAEGPALDAAPEAARTAAPEAAVEAEQGPPDGAAREAAPPREAASGDAASAEAADMVAPVPLAATPSALPGAWVGIREALEAGEMPPPEAIRVAELVAALPGLRERGGADGPAVSVVPAPWTSDRVLVRITSSAADVEAVWSPAIGDAGPIGESGTSGGATTRIYEATVRDADRPLGVVRLPDGEQVPLPAAAATPDFAAAVTGFALLLQGADLGGWSYAEAVALAEARVGADPTGAAAAVVELMRRAQALAN